MRKCFVISPIGEEGSKIRQHADDVYEFIIEPALKHFDILVKEQEAAGLRITLAEEQREE